MTIFLTIRNSIKSIKNFIFGLTCHKTAEDIPTDSHEPAATYGPPYVTNPPGSVLCDNTPKRDEQI